jgi:transposase-like protein
MTTTAKRPPRPIYTDGFKRGAVELLQARKRENPQESDYASTRIVAGTMNVSFMSIRNWARQAEADAAIEAADANDVPAGFVEDAPMQLDVTGGDVTVTIDAEATILALRTEVAELRRANRLLKTTTAYLASESLKAA